MRVETVTDVDTDKYLLLLVPRRWDKLIGRKSRTLVLKDSGCHYISGGDSIYIYQNGSKTPPGCKYALAIDNHRRAKDF